VKDVLNNFRKKFGRKPRVLILADLPGWAYDTNSKGIQKALADDFEIEIAYLHHGASPDPRPDFFDIYHICCWVDIVHHWNIDPQRIVKEVSSHRWEDVGEWGPLSPKQFCAKHLADAGVITATSRRLQEVVGAVRPVLLAPNGVSDFFEPGPDKAGDLVFGWSGKASDPCKGLYDILQPASYRLIDLKIAPGNVAHEEMGQFYQKLDVLCVASTKEGEPLPLLEGMRCGCFPICTDVGIVPELVRNGENGLIVKRSPEAFRKAFTWCLEHPEEVRAAGRANGEYIQRTRSWDRVKGAWRRAWCEALQHCTPKENTEPIEIVPANAVVSTTKDNAAWESRPKPQGLTQNLSFADWNKVIVGAAEPRAMAGRVVSGDVPEWISVLLAETRLGDACLELGSGSGLLSASLTKQGRKTSLLDFSADSLVFSQKLYKELNISGEFIHADVLEPLPFDDGVFDCVWSSGLLEHFSDAEIQHIVSESARISKGIVLSLVPNAASIPYRLGKWHQEEIGKWQYGYEDPKYTVAHFFEKANLKNVRESTVSWDHALNFMSFDGAPDLRRLFEKWYATLCEEDHKMLNQGYLLVTVGVKSVLSDFKVRK